MFGNPEVAGEEGVAFRAIDMLSRYLLQQQNKQDNEFLPRVEFSFLELYNEKVNDLLNKQASCQLSYHRTVLSPGTKYSPPKYANDERIVPQGLVRRSCKLENMSQQIASWLSEGAASRITGRTVFNAHSSRSHAVATLHILWTPRAACQHLDESGVASLESENTSEVRLYLVDLAGSERAGQYALSHDQLKEGININKSLSTLGRVVGALAKGKGECMPYRESTLTWLLSDAITGVSARAFMIAAVQPAHPAETLSTLQYAQAYSNLQSDLSWRIPATLSQVRNLQHQLRGQKDDFQRLLCNYSVSVRNGYIWNYISLDERLVRSTRSAKEQFQDHRMLSWTEAHDTKLAILDIGIVRETTTALEPRGGGDAPDGRRKNFEVQGLTQRAEENVEGSEESVASLAQQSFVKVEYPGNNGRPSVVLWYPEGALVDVRPPLCLRELSRQCEQTERTLNEKQDLLKDLQLQFAQQQQQWMGTDQD